MILLVRAALVTALVGAGFLLPALPTMANEAC
jgi:hypothetical protein